MMAKRIETSFKAALSALERLTNIRCRILETDDPMFDFSVIHEAIKVKVVDMHGLMEERNHLDLEEEDLLLDVERMVEARKVLVESDYPMKKVLDHLEGMINGEIGCLKWG